MKGGHMFTKGTNLKVRISAPIILCGIMVFWIIQAHGEEWTEAQKKVWSVIENRWEKANKGDVKALGEGIHDDGFMWSSYNLRPSNKGVAILGYKSWTNVMPMTYELKPHTIQIFGDFASAFFTSKWETGKFSGHNRELVSFMNQNGKWLIISSLSVSCEELPPCYEMMK